MSGCCHLVNGFNTLRRGWRERTARGEARVERAAGSAGARCTASEGEGLRGAECVQRRGTKVRRADVVSVADKQRSIKHVEPLVNRNVHTLPAGCTDQAVAHMCELVLVVRRHLISPRDSACHTTDKLSTERR